MPESDLPLPQRRIIESLDAIKKVHTNGIEYWLARDLQSLLGYAQWRRFAEAIERAKQACEMAGGDPQNHFADIGKKVSVGSGGQREVGDIALTRYAAYLTVMNGDPTKTEIAAAQVYFAVQTRRQELSDEENQTDARIEIRDRIKENVKALNSAAKEAGVQSFALFHDAGYRGLYGGLGLSEIKEHKGLGTNENLMDRAGRAELAANEFRITQAEEKIRRENVKGDVNARRTHGSVGREVRETIKKLGGDMPESLEPQPSIKKLSSARKKQRKDLPPSSQS